MWKNYLLVAFRNLTRNRAYSVINILGLAIGLATCLMIMVYVVDEASYDRQFKGVGSLYRVAFGPNNNDGWAAAPAPLAAAMKQDLPEIDESARLLRFPGADNIVLECRNAKDSRQFLESNGYYADSSFLRIFTYTFTAGNAQTALDRPNSMVVSQTVADKLFGKEDPIGKQVKVGLPFGRFNYTVRGVFQDKDLRSHIPVHFLFSMNNSDIGQFVPAMKSWATQNIFHTYIRLKPGTDVNAFAKKLTPYFYRKGGEELKASGTNKTLLLQPVKDIYLQSHLQDELAPNGNLHTLYILSSIALFILVIACINFMNLSTARSEKRGKEVGVRKVLGADRASLIRQFLGESFLLCCLSLALALLLAWIALPAFDAFTGKDLQPFHDLRLIGLIIGLTLFAGLLAGSYPAFYLSAFRPATVLKGKLVHHLSASLLRKGLVVFQFTISIGLILAAIVIGDQMLLFKDKDMGFDKDRQIILPLQGKQEQANYDVLRNELIKSSYVHSVTSGSSYPGIANIFDMQFYAPGKKGSEFIDLQQVSVNNNYFETMGYTLLAGRTLESDKIADTGSVILNLTAVKQLGFAPSRALGQQVHFYWQGVEHEMRIVGIVRDFNFESLHNPIRPLGFSTMNFFGNKYSYLIAKMQTADIPATLAFMHKTWDRINPATPFSYSFLDQDFARNYEKEQSTSTLVMCFTGIAILIACLGLFGLTAFAAERRTKEIGIRKVLGASVGNVTLLLSRDLIRLVGISILIACPLTAWIMQKWLDNFAFRINISWRMCLAAAAAGTLTALCTVSFQSIRAARANPIRSLRTE
jgi:putative ABC transport system permease protein